jgi:hypothetical protein
VTLGRGVALGGSADGVTVAVAGSVGPGLEVSVGAGEVAVGGRTLAGGGVVCNGGAVNAGVGRYSGCGRAASACKGSGRRAM